MKKTTYVVAVGDKITKWVLDFHEVEARSKHEAIRIIKKSIGKFMGSDKGYTFKAWKK